MKTFYTFFFLLFCSFLSNAQTVNVSGQCITGTITLNKISDMNGKAAFQGTGKVLGIDQITVTVYWIGAPDNVWVIDYEGQPYFMNTCSTSLPPATSGTSCQWTAVQGTDCTGAAPLVVGGGGTLPVTLFGFTAQEENNQALLHWKTSSELNNQGFEIQRSKDAIDWNKIGFVKGAVNSSLEKNYSFTDEDPLPGKNFYQLLQYDLDGKFVATPIVNVDIFRTRYYTISNNPGNGVYRLNIHSNNVVAISVTDMTGRRLLRQQIGAGIHQIDISKYSQGTYLLHLQIGTKGFTEKLVKQ